MIILNAEQVLKDGLLHLARFYCESCGDSFSGISRAVFNDGGFLRDIETGKRQCTARSYDRAVTHIFEKMRAHEGWPEIQPKLREHIHYRLGEALDVYTVE